MPRLFSRIFILILALLALHSPANALGWPGNNDNMFPSAPAARPYIDFDGRGFLIHGQRTFVAAGSLHYSRVPRALWRDRLLRIKRAGYNTIQTYTFWNYHEVHEGQYDFSGDKDLNAYLQLIHSLGMYAIVRIGPYVNAEWESGGWPVWLRFKPGVVVREDDPPFLNAMDRWLDHLMPIVSANQINHGGSVIMVQLENEDSRGAGTDLPNAYFQHLRDKCVALGLQVPYFFSGLNHNDNPAGNTPLDTASRTCPWYSSEFWTGWINFYSTDPNRELHLERSTWRILAYGGNGYSHYTMAGGTNFDGWNCSEQGTNYDFGAPIGQAGDFRDVYYGLKCTAQFAATFPLILENSQNSTPAHAADAPGVAVTARTAPAGTILFLDNAGGTAVATQVKGLDGIAYPTAGPLHVQAGEIMPVVEGGYPICPGVKLDMAAARILASSTQDNVTTLVVYGPPNDPAEMHFAVPASGVKIAPSPSLTQTPGHVVLKTTYPAKGLATFIFRAGSQVVRVLAENSDMAARTWLVTLDGKNDLVCGPDYVSDVLRRNGQIVVEAERRSADLTPGPREAYFVPGDAAPMPLGGMSPFAKTTASRIPVLGGWFSQRGDKEAQPGYPDYTWRTSADPQAMGADGDRSEYAWYHAVIHAPKAGNYSLNFSDAGDWISVFVRGVHAASSDIQQRYQSPVSRSLSVTLQAGDNPVTVLAAQYGHAKLHAYIGPIDQLDAKGINGPVTLGVAAAQSIPITAFRWKMDDRGESSAQEMTAAKTDGGDWADAAIAQDVFHGHVGFAWYRTTLPNIAGPHRRLHFDSVDDNATVYVNGQKIAHNVGWNNAFDAPLDGVWKEGGPNTLAVLVENTFGGGGIMGTVSLQSIPQGDSSPVQGWKMRGGIVWPNPASAEWQAVKASAAGDGSPQFCLGRFVMPAPTAVGPRPTLRFQATGLSRGFLWLNGHNLGRYPDTAGITALYLPPCWLQPGSNTLMVFDENGNSPTQAQIVEETVASHDALELSPMKTTANAQFR